MIKISKKEWNIVIVVFVLVSLIWGGFIYFVNRNRNIKLEENELNKEEIIETTTGSEEMPSTITEDQAKDIIKAMSGS